MSLEEERYSSAKYRTPLQETHSTSRNRAQPPARECSPSGYTSCADPTESAARKERLRQAEAQGQVEESAVQMVKASIARENAEAESLAAVGVSSQERIPTISRLGPVNVELMREPNDAQTGENQDARIPVVDRLVHTTGDVTTAENPLTTEEAGGKKRKPGRPAGRRKVASSPRLAP
ncbi:hypothetical protein HID58_037485, partial [Brassica napus]